METDGIELSGGQRQKLAVSRAAIRDADMIILDEPTASMDPMSESEILDAFSRMYRNKTLLMVSHRLSAAVKMDRIIFIERGRVSGIGTHKILYADNQKYRRLYNLQANKYR
jgi:ABC-type multidrug transport system fused ATPase/permease subunit